MAAELAGRAAVPTDEARAALRETRTGRNLDEVEELTTQILELLRR